MKFKILQWNISVNEDPAGIAKQIRELNPDVCCLQEIFERRKGSNAAFRLKELLPEYWHYYHPAQIWPGGEIQSNGIVSKHAAKAVSFKYLKYPALSSKITPSTEGRVYLEAAIHINKKRIVVGTTHLSYTRNFALTKGRKAENAELISMLSCRKRGYIFAGDLNSTPKSKLVLKIGDLLRHSGPSYDAKSFSSKRFFNGRTIFSPPLRRLDYIFTTPDLSVEEAKLVSSQYSDHRPIIVTLSV